MEDRAAAQLAVLQRYIADELRYMEEEGWDEAMGTPALDVLREGAAAAEQGTVLDPAAAEAFALRYYLATADGGMYGDTDMADALEEELVRALDAVTA